MTDLDINPNQCYQHVDGGIYQVLAHSKSTEDQAPCVVYAHLWPFERAVWHRPLAEFNSSRFRLLALDELAELMGGDQHEAQLKVTDAKRDRKAREAQAYRERQLEAVYGEVPHHPV